MNIEELRKKLDGLDDKAHVVVYRETEDTTEFFEISDASLSTGSPLRHQDGSVGFTFDHNGPATWLLISIEDA